jgi:hypothetical protein
MKGQVSTEYLVILAVVLVVALVVVALVGGTTPISGSVTEAQSKNYWGGVSPLAITDWKYSGTSLTLTLNNRDASQVTLTGITAAGASIYSTNTTFSAGETKTITATTSASCGSSGSSFTLSNISMTYNKGDVTANLEKGDKPIVGKCS